MKNNLAFVKTSLFVVFCFAVLFAGTEPKPLPKASVLVFSKTNGYRHKSIEPGIEAIKKLGAENGFAVEATEDSLAFNSKNLKKFRAVIFLNPTLDVLGEEQQRAFEKYIQAGGGFVGIHAAADCEYKWPWYVKLVGASFESHPNQQDAKLTVLDHKHPSTKHLPAVWERFDEWYNFKDMNPDVKVLISIDESSYKGGKNGTNHPMSWYHSYDGGRAFYTEFGHTDKSFSEPAFLQHLLGGINYAMGKK
ncbi:MAG: ThuA domain-containing protein [Gemmatimonadaceae bacterium]|nr:ThuA domain-containing protein [Chitinophagaceae bacterium]